MIVTLYTLTQRNGSVQIWTLKLYPNSYFEEACQVMVALHLADWCIYSLKGRGLDFYHDLCTIAVSL